MNNVISKALTKAGLRKESKSEHFARLIKKATLNQYGIHGIETMTLQTFLVCEAFENRFCPHTERAYHLAAMIISRHTIINLELQHFNNVELTKENWYNQKNDILFEDINTLRQIAMYRIFGHNKNQTLAEYFSNAKDLDFKKDLVLTGQILSLSKY